MAANKQKKSHNAGPLAVSNTANVIICIILGLFCLSCVLPVLLVYTTSFTDELAITKNGVSLFPETFSLEAYRMLFGTSGAKILTSYRNTILITVLGTVFGLWFMTMYGYACSRKDFKFRQFLSFYAYFTMLFSGGMVASYIVNTTMFHLRNTFWILLLPGMVGAYNIIVLRTFFASSGTESLIEAAKIDGANGWHILWNITIPTVMPSITICTFLTLTNGFKLFDQNLVLTGGQPFTFQPDGTIIRSTEMLALNIYNTFYLNSNSRGMGQAKAVLFFILVAAIALIQLRATHSREVQQ